MRTTKDNRTFRRGTRVPIKSEQGVSEEKKADTSLNEEASQEDSLDSKDEIAQNSPENSAHESMTNQEDMSKIREEFQALKDSVNVMNQEVHALSERQEVMTQDVRAIGARMTEVQRLQNGPLARI